MKKKYIPSVFILYCAKKGIWLRTSVIILRMCDYSCRFVREAAAKKGFPIVQCNRWLREITKRGAFVHHFAFFACSVAPRTALKTQASSCFANSCRADDSNHQVIIKRTSGMAQSLRYYYAFKFKQKLIIILKNRYLALGYWALQKIFRFDYWSREVLCWIF